MKIEDRRWKMASMRPHRVPPVIRRPLFSWEKT
jgi:hypothetical protein